MFNPLRALIERLGENEPLLLSHHPVCEYFAHHTVELYGQRVCMGCVVVYPTAFLTLLALVVGRVIVPDLPLYGLQTTALIGVSIGLITPLVAGKLSPVSLSARQRIIGKALLAVGLAVLAVPIVFRPTDRIVTAALFVGFLVPYVCYKALTVRDDCEGCPEADAFPNCTGMTFDGTYRYATDESTAERDQPSQCPNGWEDVESRAMASPGSPPHTEGDRDHHR